MDGNSTTENCSADALAAFSKSVGGQMVRVNALLVVNTILMGVMVGIGAYGHRYRHHPLTRFIFLGATTLFLPIISVVASRIGNQYIISVLYHGKTITGICSPRGHIFLVLVWTGLVQIVGINTTTVVAIDAKEGRKIAPRWGELLVQAIWTSYLAIYTAGGGGQEGFYFTEFALNLCSARGLTLLLLFSLIFAKTFFKYYAFCVAGRSFALGRNPRLIVGYMQKLQDSTSQHAELEHTPPPLVVMGEDNVHVTEQPHGYCFGWMSDPEQGDAQRKMNNTGLVTMDKVWQSADKLLSSEVKGLCFSFALFKLLRCRFASYAISEAGLLKARNFLWHELLDINGGKRVLVMIADELSFLHDYYYSSQPISYSKRWLSIVGIFISTLSIGYCVFLVIGRTLLSVPRSIGQLRCLVKCGSNAAYFNETDPLTCFEARQGALGSTSCRRYGSLLFDLVPVFLLLLIVVLAEVRDIAIYICSNWTKVAIVCRYFKQDSWQKSPTMQQWVKLLLQCKWKLGKPWVDKMNQCSILAHLPRKAPSVFLRHVLPLPEPKKNVEIPESVKEAILGKLRNKKETLGNGVVSLHGSVQVDTESIWEYSSKNGIAGTLLVWHIATSILEVRQLQSDLNKITATKLSRYCAYLVIYSPELLPDDNAWCKSLYKAVKKDAERALANHDCVSTPEEQFKNLVQLMRADSNQVLQDGARLADQLAQLHQGEEAAWKLLADFLLDIILYVAPSDHLDGHAEAIARGGELITLIWALLTHIGIDSRADISATDSLEVYTVFP